MSRWLNGSTTPTGEAFFKIAEFLGVDAKWLMTGENAERSANPKEPGISKTTQAGRVVLPMEDSESLRDDVKAYQPKHPPLTLEDRVARVEEVLDVILTALQNMRPKP